MHTVRESSKGSMKCLPIFFGRVHLFGFNYIFINKFCVNFGGMSTFIPPPPLCIYGTSENVQMTTMVLEMILVQWKPLNVITDHVINRFMRSITYAKAQLHFLNLDRHGVDSDIVIIRIV